MKKLYFLFVLLCFLLISCASTKNQSPKIPAGQPAWEDFPFSTYNLNAGDEITMPVDGGYICYGKTKFVDNDWDFSLPAAFGNKTFVACFYYNYYFEGEKKEVMYEFLIKDIDLYPEIQNQEMYSEIKGGTAIGRAAVDKPSILLRTANGADPNLILNCERLPLDYGNYSYYDATTFMPSTPKFLIYMPVTSRKDEIEFWDYPESLEHMIAKSLEKDNENKSKSTYYSFPMFNIMVKTQLAEYPTSITTHDMTDVILRNQFFKDYETEMTIDFDGLAFHIVFYKGFLDYLKDEYTLGDDIYLYLNGLYVKDGKMTLTVRDFTLDSPEDLYEQKLTRILTAMEENAANSN